MIVAIIVFLLLWTANTNYMDTIMSIVFSFLLCSDFNSWNLWSIVCRWS